MNDNHKEALAEIVTKPRYIEALQALRDEMQADYVDTIMNGESDERTKGMYHWVWAFVKEIEVMPHNIKASKNIRSWQ